MKLSLKHKIIASTTVFFGLGLAVGINAKADALDQNQYAATCRIVQHQAIEFIGQVRIQIDGGNKLMHQIELEKAKNGKTPKSAIADMGRQRDMLLQVFSDSDPSKISALLDSKLACRGITDPKTLRHDLNEAIIVGTARIKDFKSDIEAELKATK